MEKVTPLKLNFLVTLLVHTVIISIATKTDILPVQARTFLLIVSGFMFRDDVKPSMEDTDNKLLTDKRYARLSYYGGPRSRYTNKQHNTHSYYSNYHQPWLNLPDTECLRKSCSSDNECCRRYNKCDKSAKICIDCWYGHPCTTTRDCCAQFPYCNRQAGMCQN